MLPSVSVVLPTFQGANYLRETLPAINAQKYEGKLEIVAIDSGSSDRTVDILREFGADVEIIAQSEFGHGKTRNQLVRKAQGDIIVFLSQDALPVGDKWLQSLVDALAKPKVGAVFARQLPRAEATSLERYFHNTIYPNKPKTNRANKKRDISIDNLFFSNVCSAARRETCLRFPFNESLIMSEDQFFARDLLLGGLDVVYAPHVEVIHSHSYDLNTLFRRNFDSGYSLRDFNSGGFSRKIRKAVRFIGGEAIFLIQNKDWRALRGLPIYEGARISALLLGGQADRLPLSWRKRMSQHRSFWAQQ